MDEERIVLGSGKLYVVEFTGTIPVDSVIETTANLLGLVSGGASLEYKPKYYEATDDLALVSKTVLTEEEVTLKSGVLTWSGNTLKKLSSTARVTDWLGKRTVKIGGIGNQDGKKYLIRFKHSDPDDGDMDITIVGNNQSGFTLKYLKDKETVIDAEFKALPMDSEGTKIIFREDIELTLGTLVVTSTAGGTTGKTTLTVTPTLTMGNSYMTKTAASVTLPVLNAVCDTGAGYTAWDGAVDITATTGNEIVVVEVDSDFKALNTGKATVVSKA
ncbi:MAG: hypothetical protein ACC608_09590 [Anaerofustis sp.]